MFPGEAPAMLAGRDRLDLMGGGAWFNIRRPARLFPNSREPTGRVLWWIGIVMAGGPLRSPCLWTSLILPAWLRNTAPLSASNAARDAARRRRALASVS